jgi:hypothetical protein
MPGASARANNLQLSFQPAVRTRLWTAARNNRGDPQAIEMYLNPVAALKYKEADKQPI